MSDKTSQGPELSSQVPTPNSQLGAPPLGVTIRPALPADADRIWQILEPIIRGGEVFAWPRDLAQDAAIAMWGASSAEVYVADVGGDILATAFLKPNQLGGGSHVANGGYAVASDAEGRGIAHELCAFTLERAVERGFRAIQFNFVVSTNTRAIRLWRSFGFEIVGHLPAAFDHPTIGEVDAFVMFKQLSPKPGDSGIV